MRDSFRKYELSSSEKPDDAQRVGGRPLSISIFAEDPIGAPSGLDHRSVFLSLRKPLALVSALGDAPRVVAATQGFHDILGIGQEHAGQPILPLLPLDWRSAVEAAVRACMGPRRSKRVRRLSRATDGSQGQFELDVYRAAAVGLTGHVVLSLEEMDQARWTADPRLVPLFSELSTNNPALVFENDVKYGRARYRDNGLIALLGLSGRQSVLRSELLAATHPEDIPQVRAYDATRAALADDEIATLTVRMRAVSGEWRLITFRARVLRRDRTGAPRRMIGLMMDVTDHNAMTQALNRAASALAKAEAEERKRIGRELHDSTAQHLLAISFGLGSLERSLPHDAAMEAKVEDIRTAIDAAGREIRMFSFLLHPPEVEEFGLGPALERFCTAFGRRTGLDIRWCTQGPSTRVTDEMGAAFYRVAQEALMNAFRHARATTVKVELHWKPGSLVLEIKDNGSGAKGGADVVEGVGTRAMRARMANLGGTLELDASRGGLRIRAEAPMALKGPSILHADPRLS
jgi:signal transduction histidine kinase